MAITKELILKALEDLKAEAKDAAEKLKSSRGIVAIGKAVFEIVPHAVELSEKLGKDLNLRGADKKALAVEIMNALIPWPWWIPASFRTALLEGAVEMAVAIFNRFWKKKPSD